jgi:hypothetical protein
VKLGDLLPIVPMQSPWTPTRIRLYHSILRAALSALPIWAALTPLQAQDRITVLTRFDRLPAESALQFMEEETVALFSDAGLTFSWKQQNNTGGRADIVVWVHFRGDCRLEPSAISLPSDGPLGQIQAEGTEILPVIEVDCDRTAAMVWQNRGTLPLALATRAFGLALGRVLAHELYHYMTQSRVHTQSDLFRRGMTSDKLTAPQLRFENDEIEALRNGIRKLEGKSLALATHPQTD